MLINVSFQKLFLFVVLLVLNSGYIEFIAIFNAVYFTNFQDKCCEVIVKCLLWLLYDALIQYYKFGYE